MAAMMQSIASVLGEPHLGAIRKRGSVFDDGDWKKFAVSLEQIKVPARTLIPDLESLYQRKTFDEPLYRCADQAWLRHYWARLTHDKLAPQLDRVKAACSAHEHGLFEMLVVELDGYAMAIQSLLLTPKTFTLEDRVELKMDAGIKTCCEDRRLAIRSLAARLLRPLDEPQQEAAVRFMGAETNEERKMIVHRLEADIRRKREVAFGRLKEDGDGVVSWKVLNTLTGRRGPIRFRESSWDLDRIYFYLLIQYFGTAVLRWQPERTTGKAVPLLHDWLCAARDVEMEVERYRARSKGGLADAADLRLVRAAGDQPTGSTQPRRGPQRGDLDPRACRMGARRGRAHVRSPDCDQPRTEANARRHRAGEGTSSARRRRGAYRVDGGHASAVRAAPGRRTTRTVKSTAPAVQFPGHGHKPSIPCLGGTLAPLATKNSSA
jgi:hypothetical protein